MRLQRNTRCLVLLSFIWIFICLLNFQHDVYLTRMLRFRTLKGQDNKIKLNDMKNNIIKLNGVQNNTIELNRIKPPNTLKNTYIRDYNKGIGGTTNHFVICPDPQGRLGNLMFEFAAALGIANTLGYRCIIKPSHPLLEYFDIREQISDVDFKNLLPITEGQWRGKAWRRNKIYLSYNITLAGYFQGWDFFQNSSEDIRQTFTVKREYLDTAVSFLQRNTPEVKTLVGIHVRRGDFLSAKDIQRGKTVADKYYIKKAMDFYVTSYTDSFFVVVSDDQLWCKDNIFGDNIIFSIFKNPIIDLAIISLCDHTIITGGTFSWWAGWLAGGTVVYLKDFPRPGSKVERSQIKRDKYYFPEWIGMSNGPD